MPKGVAVGTGKSTFGAALKRDKYLLFMFLPGLLYYVIFHYAPMYGLIIAFQKFSPYKGIFGSTWVGFRNFIDLLSQPYFFEMLRNTLLLNLYFIVFGFPVPIVFALLLSEMPDGFFKRIVQSTSYLPHFISSVVIVGIVVNFLSPSRGTINVLLHNIFGLEPINFMGDASWFRTIYTSMRVWQSFGWTSIIYIAAILGINPTLYEAAMIDGAGRLQRMWHVTLPGIMPTIITLFLLRIGQIIRLGFDTVYLMQNTMNLKTSEVFQTYVYRRGIIGMDWSFATTVGFFEGMVGLVFVLVANRMARRVSETSLW